MRSRVLAVLVAVVVPLAALGVVITRSGSSHTPARLPIAASGGSQENATRGAAGADAALYPYGGIVYKAGANLPTFDGTARAYRVAGGADAESLQRLTTALGMQGEVAGTPNDGLSLQDGDAQFFVSPFGGGGWNYMRQSGDGVSSSSGVAIGCPPDADECPAPQTTIPQHPADLPSQDEATTIALDLLDRAGIDTENATVTVDDYVTQWSVRVDPIVDGVPTEGFSTTVTIGEKGVVEYAYGVLGQPEAADEYPLIGTAKAIERLNNGDLYYGGGPRPLIAVAEDAAAAAETDAGGGTAAEPPQPSVAPSGPVCPDTTTTIVSSSDGSGGSSSCSGSGDRGISEPNGPFPLPSCDGVGAPTTLACADVPPDTFVPPPPQEVTLVDAERVLMFAVSYDGSDSFLVPAYRFTTSDGPGPTVLAIDDSFLAPPPGVSSDLPVEPVGPPMTIEPQPAPEAKPGG